MGTDGYNGYRWVYRAYRGCTEGVHRVYISDGTLCLAPRTSPVSGDTKRPSLSNFSYVARGSRFGCQGPFTLFMPMPYASHARINASRSMFCQSFSWSRRGVVFLLYVSYIVDVSFGPRFERQCGGRV